MKKRLQIKDYRLKFLFLFLFLFINHSSLFIHPTYAAPDCAIQTTPRVERGLISAKQTVSSDFSNDTGSCVINNDKVAFAKFQIPTYTQLKNQFFTQVSAARAGIHKQTITGNATGSQISLAGSTDHLYNVSGDLSITDNLPTTRAGVVFVDGNFFLGPSLPAGRLGNNNTTLVFVVSGDVQIDQSVTQLNAVIISFGLICTASVSNICPTGLTTPLPTTQRLVVNGSLISFNKTLTPPIRFRRSLIDNRVAAEIVNTQIKYLAVLKYLFSETLEIRTEL